MQGICYLGSDLRRAKYAADLWARSDKDDYHSYDVYKCDGMMCEGVTTPGGKPNMGSVIYSARKGMQP